MADSCHLVWVVTGSLQDAYAQHPIYKSPDQGGFLLLQNRKLVIRLH